MKQQHWFWSDEFTAGTYVGLGLLIAARGVPTSPFWLWAFTTVWVCFCFGRAAVLWRRSSAPPLIEMRMPQRGGWSAETGEPRP